MSGMIIPPESMLEQIKQNLRDRYSTGFPILKELVQNADDAPADRLHVAALQGWADADNPLLRGPGLLVLNDGDFAERDARGVGSFAISGKTGDASKIGRFGLGQKAVFHLCDAFIIVADRTSFEHFDTINPYFSLDSTRSAASAWEKRTDADRNRLVSYAEDQGFKHRRVVLWIPFRRDDLLLGPRTAITSARPTVERLLQDFCQVDQLAATMAMLRQLRRLEIVGPAGPVLEIELENGSTRLEGPKEAGARETAFGGRFRIAGADAPTQAAFAAHEVLLEGEEFRTLQESDHWPQKSDSESPEPIPEKGAAHGAVSLVCLRRRGRSSLKRQWCVFLPVGDGEELPLDPTGPDIGDVHLLLHGFFFLDGGRRYIEGIDTRSSGSGIADAAELRFAWNRAIRDRVTLPLLPKLLRAAIDQQVLADAAVDAVTRAITSSGWFASNRAALCSQSHLVRVVEGEGRLAWRCVPPGTETRFLPRAFVDAPERLEQLLPGALEWARTKGLVLCVDARSALTSTPSPWQAHELSELLELLPAKVLQSRALSALLDDLLATAAPERPARVIGTPLVAVLRKALIELQDLAPSETIAAVLRHVPGDMLLPLPGSVERRAVLRALAGQPDGPLAVRSEWATTGASDLDEAEIRGFLDALEPLVDAGGEDGDEAAIAALSIIARSSHSLQVLAADPDIGRLKVLRARSERLGRDLPRSLQSLVQASADGLLFGPPAPQARELLKAAVDALLDVDPVIVSGKTHRHLVEHAQTLIRIEPVNRDSIARLIGRAAEFGSPSARARLVEAAVPVRTDPPRGWRALCAADIQAGDPIAKLYEFAAPAAEGAELVESVVSRLIARLDRQFLIPSLIAGALTSRAHEHLGIERMDIARVARLLHDHRHTLRELDCSAEEREALVLAGLPDYILAELPIHDRHDGSIGPLAGEVYRDGEWPIPSSMTGLVLRLRPFRHVLARTRQEQLVRPWSPLAQISLGLGQPSPASFCDEILDALASTEIPLDLLGDNIAQGLQTSGWLKIGAVAAAPIEVLDLSPSVTAATRECLPAATFYTFEGLPAELHAHPGLIRHRALLFPDRPASIAKLLATIAGAELQATWGAANAELAADFAKLAREFVSIAADGWPLLSALLREVDDTVDLRRIVEAFTDVSSLGDRAAFLDSLAQEAEKGGVTGEAARRLYAAAFGAVRSLSNDDRRQLFGLTRVRTAAGSWALGSRVIERGAGVDRSYLLSSELAQLLEVEATGAPCAATAGVVHSADEITATHIESNRLDAVETTFFTELRAYLSAWQGKVPPDLIILLIGLLGRQPAAKALAHEWESAASTSHQTIWERLDYAIDPLFAPVKLQDHVNEFRYRLALVDGETVEVTSLAGTKFRATRHDDRTALLVGNLHSNRERLRSDDGRFAMLITLPVRAVDAAEYGQADAERAMARLVKEVAAQCVGLSSNSYAPALDELAESARNVAQATLSEVCQGLEDGLFDILRSMKLERSTRTCELLDIHADDLSRARQLYGSSVAYREELASLNARLWQGLQTDDCAAELLEAVRSTIMRFGYAPSRVLFELLQNADDAHFQLATSDDGIFRLEVTGSDETELLRAIHWGRPINHLGADPEKGRRLGYGRDLENMLRMNFSEKRDDDGVTGKFGLGFKSVHMLTSAVGIVSNFLSLRVRGGLLPTEWNEGFSVGAAHRVAGGAVPTVIDIPVDPDRRAGTAEALESFLAALSWLPLFTRRIRKLEVVGSKSLSASCDERPVADTPDISYVKLVGSTEKRVLRFDLGQGFSLVLGLDAYGPHRLPAGVPRLWNLAPLSDEVGSHWLLNGPFAVDPGRSCLTGAERNSERLRGLGACLGERLVALYEASVCDWGSVAECLGLEANRPEGLAEFWRRMFTVLESDPDDALAARLHGVGIGYGHLIASHSALPTWLPEPFPAFIGALEATCALAGALDAESVFSRVSHWPALQACSGKLVAARTANFLRKLGFAVPTELTIARLIDTELGHDQRVDAAMAARLGEIINFQDLETPDLYAEALAIKASAARARFLNVEGQWVSAQNVVSRDSPRDDERRIAAFAPRAHELSPSYTERSWAFFEVARTTAGYTPTPHFLAGWARQAATLETQQAVLRYLVQGDNGRAVANELNRNRPTWLQAAEPLSASHPLCIGLTEWEIGHLLWLLNASQEFENDSSAGIIVEPAEVLANIFNWWEGSRTDLAGRYDDQLYPSFFRLEQLRSDDRDERRLAWFTLIAIACFHSLGRTQEGQHCAFLEASWANNRAWRRIALSEPPTDVEAWLECLNGWADPTRDAQDFLLWRRVFVDLYTIAHHLPSYITVLERFPQIVMQEGPVSFRSILQPLGSTVYAKLGIEAAPIDRSLGIGINWLVRELARSGFYAREHIQAVAPYSFAASQRVRQLLDTLGCPVAEARSDNSRGIYEFIAKHLGEERALFMGDLDLPLQIITRARHKAALDDCFVLAGADPADLEALNEDEPEYA